MTVDAVRAFNRFYTGVIGVLDRGYLDSPYSLTEVRVLFELAHTDAAEVVDLRRDLGLDAGYLSRMLTRFEQNGLVLRSTSPRDARRQVAALTELGRTTFHELDRRSEEQIAALLNPVAAPDRLVAAMGTIQRLLQPEERAAVLRNLKAGDLGWIVHRHGVRYAEEYGFDATFEQLVAKVVADFGGERDAAWIAEVDGEPVGSVLCVQGDAPDTAKLRLLLVEPQARGLGVGTLLVDNCLRFATESGYARIELWTVDELHAARRIYQRAGFVLAEETPQERFGRRVVGQTWCRTL